MVVSGTLTFGNEVVLGGVGLAGTGVFAGSRAVANGGVSWSGVPDAGAGPANCSASLDSGGSMCLTGGGM